jgi:5,10-methenyltetrahydrofolate synthetase
VLRARLLSLRRGLEPAQREHWDNAIAAHVLAWQAAVQVTSLGVYWPLQGEPDLRATYAALAAEGVALALPVVIEKAAPLAFTDWIPGEPMVRDRMGVAVPAQLRPRPAPQGLLIPCLGFNRGRLRLGYGGGYYDRTLEHVPRPLTAGIAYACLGAEFDGNEYDIALDAIITEQGISGTER